MNLQYPGGGKFVVTNQSIDDTKWWAVTTPIDCNGWMLRCSVDCHVRSDPNDATTEDDLPAGVSEECLPALSGYVPNRYRKGDTLIYIKSQAGATTLYARFYN